MKNKQYTQTILMVEPVAFHYNAQTAVNNYFQQKPENSADEIQALALQEFRQMVSTLREKGVNVITIKDLSLIHI